MRVIANYTSRQWETHAFSDFEGKMFCLGHNFGSRHARRSSKSSIDAGDYLVSRKSLIQNFPHWIGVQGLSKLVKKTKTPPLSETLPGEPLTQIKKFFLIEPRRLAASVEGLNNSLAIAAGELQPKKHAPIYWRARSLKGSYLTNITRTHWRLYFI